MPATWKSHTAPTVGAGVVSGSHPVGSFDEAILFFVAQKENVSSGPITAATSGLTKLGEILSTTGVAGSDTGPVRIAAFARVLDETETSAAYSFNVSTDVAWVLPVTITVPLYGVWTIDAVTGVDTAGGVGWSAVCGSINLQPSDLCVVVSVIPTDVSTPSQFTAENITAAGITFGAASEIVEPDTSSGSDLGGFAFIQTVDTGSGTVAPTVTATVGGTTTNVYGATIFVRLRHVEPLASQTDSVYYDMNVGSVDITSVAPREDATYVELNVAAFEVAGELRIEPWGFGEILNETMLERLEIDGEACTYLYMYIT